MFKTRRVYHINSVKNKGHWNCNREVAKKYTQIVHRRGHSANE